MHFQSRAAGVHIHRPQKPLLKFKGTRKASSPSLCSSVRAVPWADEAEQQFSRLALSACELSADVRILGAGQPEAPCSEPKYTFEVCGGKTRISVSLCASVRAVPWTDEAEQQLSRLALSFCEQSAVVRLFRAGLQELPCTDTKIYV